jgi:hypothetical protein
VYSGNGLCRFFGGSGTTTAGIEESTVSILLDRRDVYICYFAKKGEEVTGEERER